MKSILNSNQSHQPDEYGHIEAHFKRHENAHWTLEEIKLEKDKTNWMKSEIIDDNAKQFATNVFRFFTQGDEDIQDAYTDIYLPVIKNQNIRGMMLSFANREVLHVKAYRKLIVDLGQILTGNEKAVYKQDVGVYDWQKKGSYKIWNHLGSIFGLSGKSALPITDETSEGPIWAVKKAEIFENLR